MKIFIALFFVVSIAQGQMQWVKTSYPNERADIISISPNGTIFVVRNLRNISYSTDLGINWQKSNIDSLSNKTCFAYLGDEVYIGSDRGVYSSTNNGIDFSQSGLENRNINDLLIMKSNKIVALTNYYGYSTFFVSNNFGYSWKEARMFNHDAPSINRIFSRNDTSYFHLESHNGLNNNWFGINVIDTNMYYNNSLYMCKTFNYVLTNVFKSSKGYFYISSTNDNKFLRFDIKNNYSDTLIITALKGITNMVTSNDEKIFVSSIDADGVFYSNNSGLSWQEIFQGLNNEIINSLAIDSTGQLLAGTSKGIYKLNQLVNDINDTQTDIDYKLSETSINVMVYLSDNVKALGLYDILGHKINYICDGNKVIIDKGLLPSGVLFLMLRVNEHYKTVKILI